MQSMSSSTYNHSIADYANIVAQGIIVLDQIYGDDRRIAYDVQQKIKEVLIPIFFSAIELEKGALESDLFQCDRELYDIGNYFAINAINAIYEIKDNPYVNQFKTIENWEKEMITFIGTNVRTAMHLERLEFARNTPNNISAHKYLTKFGVI